jgi:fucose 4-O-acetylase-like acetyltransferase
MRESSFCCFSEYSHWIDFVIIESLCPYIWNSIENAQYIFEIIGNSTFVLLIFHCIIICKIVKYDAAHIMFLHHL